MNHASLRAIATIGLLYSAIITGSAWAGSVAMDNGAERNAEIQAYVNLYGAAAAGNRVALDNLRIMARLYDAETLTEAADLAFDTHGILVYPSQPREVADTATPGGVQSQGG